MTSQDPLKSAISIGNVDDTSLALPSANQYRSGQQRVLEQVQTIKRTKSRLPSSSSRSGSTSLSPTSPSYDSVFIDGLRSQSSPPYGSVFGNGFSQSYSFEKNINRQIVNNSKGPTMKRIMAGSTYQYERGYAPLGSLAVGRTNTSRSEPDLAWNRSMPKRSAPQQRNVSSKNTYTTQRSTSQFITSAAPKPQPPPANGTGPSKSNSQFICSQTDMSKVASKPPTTDFTTKSKGDSGFNESSGVADITMKEAVEYLSSEDQAYQHCGASYIQHNAYVDDKTKEEVLKFDGILPLVGLLRSPSPQVSRTASAALRNLSFKSDKIKEEIHRCNGITEVVALLRDTDSVEIHKQLTGLLWNLSSAEDLKPDLVKSALPVLLERVILPYTTSPNSGNGQDPDVFFNTTGCLRNLSSAKQSNRQTMRKCRGLIDSLVSYVKDCVEAGKPDDKSVENCVCILHNLTFQLEAEAPALFSRITALSKVASRSNSQGNSSQVGCFSPQSSKASEHERHFDFPVVEEQQPSGAGWLIHSKTLQSYLSLLGSSKREETQEACCGALQNLTAHEGIVSQVMSQTIVQKLNGLPALSPLLRSRKANLQRSTVALVGNLTKNPNLHSAIGRKMLPDLLALLSEGTTAGNESDDTLAMACQIASRLVLKEPEMTKNFLNKNLIKSLNDLSRNNYFPKSSKTAAMLLFKLWSDKDLQSFLKKQGMSKSSFVNDTTTAAHRSLQVVD
ncbi:plakophilin-1 [Stegastes partitus]|uniref:Plakophilin-1-like n=1 Tax=Stegastes partitus TaxID=144197 RepID=A0A3B4Z0I9_9TELE|nr:PREDICTED: plakophilin-1-like [Stegastes partitus]